MKRFFRSAFVCALALSMAFTVFLTSCSISYDGNPVFNFNTVRYEAPDTAALEECFSFAEKMAEKCADLTPEASETGDGINKYRMLIQALNDMAGKFTSFVSMFSLARLEYFEDMSDTGAMSEYNRLSSLYSGYYNTYIRILGITAKSPIGEIALSEKDREFILNRSKYSDNEQFAVLSREMTEISDEYIARYSSVEMPSEETETAVARLFIRLAKKGEELAAAVGENSYAEYAYGTVFDRDYTPEEIGDFCEYVRKYISPLSSDVLELTGTGSRTRLTNAENLAVSILNGAISGSSSAYSAFDGYISAYAASVDASMGRAYEYMKRCNLYRQGTSEHAYSGAYTSVLGSYDAPYIYAKRKWDYRDINTFVHEFGHFYAFYMDSPNANSLDIDELQSQGNEYLFADTYEKIGGAELKSAMLKILLSTNVVDAIAMGCIMDELQQYVYANADALEATPERVGQRFRELLNDYGLSFIAERNERFARFWSLIPHTFSDPFYYISYAVSQIPALELFELCESRSRDRAVESYFTIITAESDGLSDLMQKAGLASPFEEDTHRKIRDSLTAALGIAAQAAAA